MSSRKLPQEVRNNVASIDGPAQAGHKQMLISLLKSPYLSPSLTLMRNLQTIRCIVRFQVFDDQRDGGR